MKTCVILSLLVAVAEARTFQTSSNYLQNRCMYQDGTKNKRGKKACKKFAGCDWDLSLPGGGACAESSRNSPWYANFETYCNFKEGTKNKRGKKECNKLTGCSWASGKGGGQCSEAPLTTEEYCNFKKPGSKNKRGKKECKKLAGCGWLVGKGGGQCSVSLAVDGLWVGEYACPQGRTKLALSTYLGNDIIFHFSGHPENSAAVPTGMFSMKASPVVGGVSFKQDKWIHQPKGYTMVNLEGVNLGYNVFAGKVDHPDCKSFVVYRQTLSQTSAYCKTKAGTKNKRGKKDCKKLPVCSWDNSAKGGGQCDADVARFVANALHTEL